MTAHPSPVCAHPGCDRVAGAKTKNLCAAHYFRARKGTEMDAPIRVKSTPAYRARIAPQVVAMRERGAPWAEIVARFGVSKEMLIETVGRLPRGYRHGTRVGYGRGCRCESCVEAYRAYSRGWRAERVQRGVITAEHGTQAAYAQGCTCRACRAAMVASQKRINDQTQRTAHRNGYAWTGPEMEIALRDDLTIRQRAEMLGRTRAAVSTMIAKLRNSVDDPCGVHVRNGE